MERKVGLPVGWAPPMPEGDVAEMAMPPLVAEAVRVRLRPLQRALVMAELLGAARQLAYLDHMLEQVASVPPALWLVQ